MNAVNSKKLLLSKWTAVQPIDSEKHFLVTKVEGPPRTDLELVWIEIEAVHSRASRRIRWRELRDEKRWAQGWI